MSGTSGTGLSSINNAIPYNEYSKTLLQSPYDSSLGGNTYRYENVMQGGKSTKRKTRCRKGGKSTKRKTGRCKCSKSCRCKTPCKCNKSRRNRRK